MTKDDKNGQERKKLGLIKTAFFQSQLHLLSMIIAHEKYTDFNQR